MERKGFGIRLGAVAIDIGFLIVISMVLSLILLGSMQVSFSSGQLQVTADMLRKLQLYGIVSGLVMLAYAATELFMGRTPGKMILGLSIAGENGTPAPMGQLATRWAVKWSPVMLGTLEWITLLSFFGILELLAGIFVIVAFFMCLRVTRLALYDQMSKTAVFGRATVMQPGFQPMMGQGQYPPGQYPPPGYPPPGYPPPGQYPPQNPPPTA